MSQNTLVNGNRFSFVNLSVNVNAIDGGFQQPPKGSFKSITYKATQEPGKVQGNQVTQVGRTAGYGVSSGSFEMLVSELDDLYSFLTQGGLFPIMSVDFDIVVSYSVNDIDVRVDTLQGCRITDIDSPNQQGTDATMKTNTIDIARLYLNGIPAFGDPSA